MIEKIDFMRAAELMDSCNGGKGYKPLGKFLYKNELGGYTGIDNEDGYAWTEDFKSESAARRWLIHG